MLASCSFAGSSWSLADAFVVTDGRNSPTHAQNANPSVVESVSNFYAEHTTLVKTLGGAALTIALAKVAERQRQA
jgi:hypothetical protein